MKRFYLFLLPVVAVPGLSPLGLAQLTAEADPSGRTASNSTEFRSGAIEPRRAGAGISGSATQGIRWKPVLKQAGMFYGISHGWRIIFQGETRSALKGPFFKDYTKSLEGLGGWSDGDPIITNYVGHPMQGSTTMWILTQNDPKGAGEEFSFHSKPYWTSRMKGLGFSTAYSTFYELSPFGDAAIGNVGLDPATKGAVDLVVTPSLGMGWHLAEDMVDKYFIRWVERKTGNIAINSLVRIWLNPTRTVANCLRFKTPWRRDTREGVREIRRQREMRALSHRR
ncbi:MAG: hypothetical protein GY953_49635 [bacterium]|nr:hypothetical protein [bacterium]